VAEQGVEGAGIKWWGGPPAGLPAGGELVGAMVAILRVAGGCRGARQG
jgi:hypothetical protein